MMVYFRLSFLITRARDVITMSCSRCRWIPSIQGVWSGAPTSHRRLYEEARLKDVKGARLHNAAAPSQVRGLAFPSSSTIVCCASHLLIVLLLFLFLFRLSLRHSLPKVNRLARPKTYFTHHRPSLSLKYEVSSCCWPFGFCTLFAAGCGNVQLEQCSEIFIP